MPSEPLGINGNSGNMKNSEKSYSIYVLKCSDESLYTSSSLEDKDSFLRRHNDGKGEPYTKGRLPVKLFWMHEGIKNRWVARETTYAIRSLHYNRKRNLFKGDKIILDEVLSKGIKNGPIREKNYEKYLKIIGKG